MIKYTAFKGSIPKMASHLLPEGYGQTAENCRLEAGALQVARDFDMAQNISAYTSNPKQIFKFQGKTLLDTDKMAWLWWNKKIDIVAGEKWHAASRIFWSTGIDAPRQTILDLLGTAATTVEDMTKIKTPTGAGESLPLAVDSPYLAPEKDIYYTWGLTDAWGEGVSYSSGDIRRLTKVLVWRCVEAHTPASTEEYVPLTSYTQKTCPQIWVYMSKYWEPVVDTVPTSVFNDGTSYSVGDVMCVAMELPFKCIQDHVSDNPDPDNFEFKEYSDGDIVQYRALDDALEIKAYQRNSTAHSSGVPPEPTNTTYWTEITPSEGITSELVNTPGYGTDWANYWKFEYSGEPLGRFAYAYTFVSAWGIETKPSPVLGPFEIKEREFIGVVIPRDTVKYPDNNGFPPYITHVRLYRTATGESSGTDFYYVPYYTVTNNGSLPPVFGSNPDGMPIADVVAGLPYYDCSINADGTLPDDINITINQMLEEALETFFYDPPPERHYDSSGNILDIAAESYNDVYAWTSTSIFHVGTFVLRNSHIYRAIKENVNIEPGVTPGWETSWELICETPVRSEYLRGLTSIPGGSLAGFIDDDLFFSEPYMAHAWPRGYKRSLDHKIVGIGVSGQEAIVCTEGYPYLLTGTHPETCMVTRLPYPQACLSKQGIVSTESGVIYPSPDGLFMIVGGQGSLLTKDLYDKKQWQALNPSTLDAQYYENHYVGAFVGTGKILMLNLASSIGVVYLDIPGFEFVSSYHHVLDDSLYFLGNAGSAPYIGRFNILMDASIPYTWKSKKVFLPNPQALSCMGVVADSGGSVTVKIYCDNVLIYTKTITNTSTFRLPAVMGKAWEVELTGTATVYSFEMGASIGELNNG